MQPSYGAGSHTSPVSTASRQASPPSAPSRPLPPARSCQRRQRYASGTSAPRLPLCQARYGNAPGRTRRPPAHHLAAGRVRAPCGRSPASATARWSWRRTPPQSSYATEPERVLSFAGDSPRPLRTDTERDRTIEALRQLNTTDLLLGQDVGAVLYVEDQTDERILRAWAKVLDHPLQEFFSHAYVHWLGAAGWRTPRSITSHSTGLSREFLRCACSTGTTGKRRNANEPGSGCKCCAGSATRSRTTCFIPTRLAAF